MRCGYGGLRAPGKASAQRGLRARCRFLTRCPATTEGSWWKAVRHEHDATTSIDATGGREVNILGLNYYFHDSTACVVMDGKLMVAIEEERLTRNKHTTEFPRRSIDRCLKIAGLTPQDIDAVAVSLEPTKDWATKVRFGITHRKSLSLI